MTTVYKFKATFTKSGAATTPSSAATIAVVGVDDTILVAALTPTTALANLPGTYIYSYSGADGLDPIGRFTTTDATMDQTTLDSYTSIETREILVDTGTTIPASLLALQGADGDTLETLSDQLEGLVGADVSVVGPIATGGNIDIVSGDDYYNTDNRALEWSSSAWPDLTGATVVFITGNISIACTLVTVGAGLQTVRLELSSAQSAAFPSNFNYDIEAVLSNGHKATIVRANGIKRNAT